MLTSSFWHRLSSVLAEMLMHLWEHWPIIIDFDCIEMERSFFITIPPEARKRDEQDGAEMSRKLQKNKTGLFIIPIGIDWIWNEKNNGSYNGRRMAYFIPRALLLIAGHGKPVSITLHDDVWIFVSSIDRFLIRYLSLVSSHIGQFDTHSRSVTRAYTDTHGLGIDDDHINDSVQRLFYWTCVYSRQAYAYIRATTNSLRRDEL